MRIQKLILSLVTSVALLIPTFLLAEEVNIYSTRQEFLMRPFLNVFEQQTGINVNVVYIKSGLLERLKAEGMNSPADVVLTVDISNLTKLANEGVLQPIDSEVIEANIAAEFRNPEGLWTGLTARARVIYYSKDRVDVNQLSTYEDLVDPKYRGRICTRSGLHNYNIALLSSIIAHHGRDYALNWAKGLLANLARKPQGNDRAQVKAISEGECDFSLGNSYYMGKMLENPDQRDWAASAGIFFPNQKNRGTHMNISGGGVTKSSNNLENAIRLLEFLTDNLAQQMYAQVNHEYPLKKGVMLSGIVQSFGKGQPGIENGVFKRDTTDLATIGNFRTEAFEIMNEAGYE